MALFFNAQPSLWYLEHSFGTKSASLSVCDAAGGQPLTLDELKEEVAALYLNRVEIKKLFDAVSKS